MKIKKLFLCFIFIVSCFCMVSCKKNEDPDDNKNSNEKQTPAIAVTISKDDRFVGDRLGDIELQTIGNCTPGILAWENDDYILVYGDNLCKWIFTPTDQETYSVRTGSIVINAKNQLADITVSNVRLKSGSKTYVDALYSTIELDCESSVEGTISILDSDKKTFVEGKNTLTWKFTPTENELYRTKTGTIEINVSEQQYLESVSVKSNTKKSGYKAFDEFDCSGLTLNLIYNAGKVTPITNVENDCTVRYKTDNCLHRGDTSVTVSYKSFDFVVEIDEVDFAVLEKPTFDDIVVYDGTVKNLRVTSSYLYQFTPLQKTDAGEYDLELTLTDSENYKWSDSETDVTIVKCAIQKAELNVTENEFDGVYDGVIHTSTVESENASSVYYSNSPLNYENYLTGSTTFDGFIDAGTYSIYYYAVGDKNHNSLAGMLVVQIDKQTPIMSLKYCYTIKTGTTVNYPASYILIKSEQDVLLENKNLTFTYYSVYSDDGDDSNDIKTSLSTGASFVGGAPINERTGGYTVVVEYAGDDKNFNGTKSSIALYIDSANNGFYDTTGTNSFAFKDSVYEFVFENSQYSIGGSNQECANYLEFELLPKNQYGLIEVGCNYKFGLGKDIIKHGKLVYDNGYHIESEDGNIIELILDDEKSTISMSIDNNPVDLKKWVIPKYLKSFGAETISDEDFSDKNTSKNTTITFYNDYGTIRFSADVNVAYKNNEFLGGKGGHETWSGVVVAEIARDKDQILYYKLNCYISNKDSLESEGFDMSNDFFVLKWRVKEDGVVNPSSLIFDRSDQTLSKEPYLSLNTTYEAV